MRARIAVAAGLALLVMAWLAAVQDDWRGWFPFGGEKSDYYNLLVDGFREGHLHLKAEVHPDRLSPDPAVRVRSPYLLDASLYAGRYYLYFGVVPAVLQFWPWVALTGADLPQNFAVFLSVALAFLVLLRVYTAARARYFPDATATLDVTAVFLLAFGNCTPVLLKIGGMYEVAIASAYLWAAVLVWCLFEALHSARPLRWIAGSSLALGLAVGSRPTYLLLAALIVATAVALLRRADARRDAGALLRLALAAAGPAAVIGLGLAWYNYARFGDPLEFGMSYQLNALTGTDRPLYRLDFIPLNLGWYYFSPPVLGPYFPYIFPLDTSNAPGEYFGSEPVHGQWFTTLLALVVAAACWAGRDRWRDRAARTFLFYVTLVAAAFGALALVTSYFSIRSNRYMVDFQIWLILGLVLAAGLSLAGPGPAPRRWLRRTVAGLGAAIVAANLLIALQLLEQFQYTHPRDHAALARLGLLRHGPVRFTVEFAPTDRPVQEPLLATGTPGYKDILYAAQHPGGHIELIMYHEGFGGPRSPLLKIEYGKPYVIEVDMGSLYPPAAADFFPGWGDRPREILKTLARVTLDGREVIRTRQAFFDAPPSWVDFGSAPGRADNRPFSGRISAIERLPIRSDATLGRFSEPGVARLRLDLPAVDQVGVYPVLGSGTSGAGNLLFLETLPDGTFRFGLDFWGHAVRYSPPLPRPPPATHTVEVFIGPQVARHLGQRLPELKPADLGTSADLIRVWIDGQPVWETPVVAHAESYDFVSPGTNTQGFSTATSSYPALIQPVPLADAEIREAILRNRPTAPTGLWQLNLVLPAGESPGGHPLLSSGRAGHGNLLFLELLPGERFRLGMDFWGHGALYSPPLSRRGAAPQRLEIFVGPQVARHPPLVGADPGAVQAAAPWLRIWLDGEPVWTLPMMANADTYDEVFVGTNPQGFSTAAPAYVGAMQPLTLSPEEFRAAIERNLRLPWPARP